MLSPRLSVRAMARLAAVPEPARNLPTPPHDPDAEEAVLGALLIGADPGVVADTLTTGCFYRQSNGLIYQACLDLYTAGSPVDAITVVDRLDLDGNLAAAGGKARVHELAGLAVATAPGYVGHHAGIVRELAQIRGVIRAANEMAVAAWERQGSAAEIVDRAEQSLFTLAQGAAGGDLGLLKEPMMASFGEALAVRRTGELPGLPSGLMALDRVTAGFRRGNLIVLAARPGMGKTGLALTVGAHVCYRQGLPVALFTLEMSLAEVSARLLCMEANVDLFRYNAGRFDQAEEQRLVTAGNRIAPLPFFADETAATVAEIRSKARRTKARNPELALIIVDYLQLLAQAGAENRTQEVTQISRGLKRLAIDLDIPVIALSQLSRAVEQRNEKRPILSDLRESGSVEQDADIVGFLYRDDYYHDDSDQPGIAELNIAKNRNGPTPPAIKLAFLKSRAKFGDLLEAAA